MQHEIYFLVFFTLYVNVLDEKAQARESGKFPHALNEHLPLARRHKRVKDMQTVRSSSQQIGEQLILYDLRVTIYCGAYRIRIPTPNNAATRGLQHRMLDPLCHPMLEPSHRAQVLS